MMLFHMAIKIPVCSIVELDRPRNVALILYESKYCASQRVLSVLICVERLINGVESRNSLSQWISSATLNGN
jgi:hypothetical protein